MSLRLGTVLTIALAALTVPGCEDVEIERAPTRAEREPPPPPAAEPERSGGYAGGSSLGAAKRAAQNTAGQLEQHQKEMAEQINRLEGGSPD